MSLAAARGATVLRDAITDAPKIHATTLAIVALNLALTCGTAQAHTTSTGLATLVTSGGGVAYRLTLAPGEIGEPAEAIVRGAAGDASAAARAGQLLQAHVSVAVDGQACRVNRTRIQASQLGDDRVALLLDFRCDAAPGRLQLGDTLSTPFGEHYRSIVSVVRPDGTREERVLDREHATATFDFGHAAPSSLGDFARLGVEHILSGPDHLLFLAALLLGSRGLRSLLITITAFTAAHSLSLAAATLGWAHVSVNWVEPAIAASIVWMAVENLLPGRAAMRRHLLTFAFGLAHGLGFAEALTGLQLTGWPLARALLGFNLGVELGQAVVVLLLAPALAWIGRRAAGPRIARGLSVGIAGMGLIWLAQRLVPA
jgi:hydrogenase/urease accessory protein HupE